MNKNFDYLGNTFQIQLLNQIIVDKDFSQSIMDVIESSYFDNKYFKIILQLIKEYYKKYRATPNFDTLDQIIKSEISQELVLKIVLDTIVQVKNAPNEGASFVQEKALKFCKQQELQKAMDKAQKIISEGDFESYDKVEGLVRNALQVGEIDKGTTDIFQGLDTVLDEDYRHPIPMGIPGIDKLLKGGLSKGEIGVILAPTGVGKAQPISEPVLTPNGWTNIGDLKVGDKVVGSDGKEQYVLGIYPQGEREIYKVEFTDGTFVNCDKEHLWSVNTLNMRTAKTRVKGKGVYRPNYGYKVLKTSDMMGDIKKRGRYNYRIPVVEPVEFQNVQVDIDPYLLGILLGDGSLRYKNVTLSTKDDEIYQNISHLNEHTSFSEYTKQNLKTINVIRFRSSFTEKLEKCGLSGKKSNNKFIPKEYLYNSVDVRVALLQGLMDTDGYIDKKGISQFTTVSEQLSKDFRELVLSLGGTVRVTTKIPTFIHNGVKKEGQLAYNVTISFANNIVPFRLLRKVSKYYKREKYVEQKFIKSITYSHNEDAVCIKVSNPDELYVTRDYVLTHNTTVLTKVANTAFNMGYNVLQIFFEDNPKIIQRKHFTIWTGIAPDELSNHKEEVISKVTEIKESMPNKLILKKMASDSVNMSYIKNQIRKMIADGTTIDLVVIDYIDCILPEIAQDEWKAEGSVMRAFEAMCHELNLAGWVATQGNRQSISSEIVTTDQMGGSIKKAQVGHVIITVAKTLQQKEMNLATIAITKSRLGKDGIVFENCKFNNEMMDIDTDSSVTFLGFEEHQEERKRDRVKELLEKRKQRQEQQKVK
jgi:intein/homing endonuclease